MSDLSKLFISHIDFCNDIFPHSTETSCLHHAVEEICEIWKEADEDKKPEEYVDAIMCLLYGMNRASITLDEFKGAFLHKLQKNKSRKWNKNKDDSYSHEKTLP